VVSTTLDKVTWGNSFLITGDIREQVAHLKADRGPEIQVHGSWQLIQTLMKYDLVDEYRVWTFPLLLGSGKRLLSDGTIPAGLRLVDSKISSTGVIIATYKRAGELERSRWRSRRRPS
jgi:dihydrofolate reductase